MRETYEFRVVEDYAHRLFRPDEGKLLGSGMIRLIKLSGDDPRLPQVGELRRIIDRESGRTFFHGWNIERRYSKAEIEAATLFRLQVTAVFEPAGEERGTKYDEASACSRCGAGAQQIGPLILDLKRIPKGKDIAKTIAGEIVVSQRVVELLERHRITGVALNPVRMSAASSAESRDWFQLTVQHVDAEIVAPTRVGIDPFNDDASGECRCPLGDLIGLNLLSEVTIGATTRGQADFVGSRQFIGVRRGLLRPERVVFISPRVRALFEAEKLKGAEVEIARLA
jgi:hypothetical protein